MALFNVHSTNPIKSKAGIRKRKRTIDLQRGELKFFDGDVDDPISPTLVFSEDICAVTQGTGQQQRIGKQILVKELHINLKLFLNVNTFQTDASDIIRFAVYLDKQSNGANPTAALLLTNNNILGFRNLSNAERFKCLFSCTYNIEAVATIYDTVAAGIKNIKKQELYHIHLTNLNIPIFYKAAAGLLSSLASNNIFFTLQSALTEKSEYEATHRIRFYDF